MALSPTSAISARDIKRAEEIAQLETDIDRHLEQAFDSDQLVYDVAPGLKSSVLDAIVNRYRAAGWTVEARADFHNNRQLVLQAPA